MSTLTIKLTRDNALEQVRRHQDDHKRAYMHGSRAIEYCILASQPGTKIVIDPILTDSLLKVIRLYNQSTTVKVTRRDYDLNTIFNQLNALHRNRMTMLNAFRHVMTQKEFFNRRYLVGDEAESAYYARMISDLITVSQSLQGMHV